MELIQTPSWVQWKGQERLLSTFPLDHRSNNCWPFQVVEVVAFNAKWQSNTFYGMWCPLEDMIESQGRIYPISGTGRGGIKWCSIWRFSFLGAWLLISDFRLRFFHLIAILVKSPKSGFSLKMYYSFQSLPHNLHFWWLGNVDLYMLTDSLSLPNYSFLSPLKRFCGTE